MRTVEKRTAEPSMVAFAVSLVAGLLILVGSALMFGMFGIPYNDGMMGGYYQAVGATYHMMPWVGGWFFAAFIGVVSGTAVILGACLLYFRPGSSLAWGTFILIFSALSLFGMGGFFLGAFLGVVGGVVAITLGPHSGSSTV